MSNASTKSYTIFVERLPEDPRGSSPKTLKALRALDRRLNLGELKAIAQLVADHLPCVIASGIDEARGRAVVDALSEAGGAARLEPSSLNVPLIARPLHD